MTDADQTTYLGTAEPSSSHTTSETPSWLLTPATGGDIPPPVQTHSQLLPLGQLGWDDFERICFRLLRTQVVGAVRATIYGAPGQAQHGIDMYAVAATSPDGAPDARPYVTLQSRRIINVTQANLQKGVDDFLEEKWADNSQKFIYATSSSARSKHLLDKVEELATRLGQQSIAFEVWDQERISEMLKEHPALVNDFFGRSWVTAFCGENAAHQMGNRLEPGDIAKLRGELGRIYTRTFGLADPGFAGFRLNDLRRVELLDRYVTPDLVSAEHQTASYPYRVAMEADATGPTPDLGTSLEASQDWMAWFPDEYGWPLPGSLSTERISQPTLVVERRSADQWLGTEHLQVIIGDPGAGKSALLRYLVLDLLREEPQWKTVAEHWGEYLPVWLPFNFLAQRVIGQTGEPATVSHAIKAWLEQNESAQIWPLVERALENHRLLLVVDGLDEWTSDEAGRYAARAVEKIAAIHGIPVVASTRPYGLSRLTLDTGWVYSRIAPLTYQQQRSLASHYFLAASSSNSSTDSDEIIDKTVDDFLANVLRVPELSAFSGTPLFLVMLVMLRLSSSSQLPIHRFDVYARALQLLVADLPHSRRTSADVTAVHQVLPQHDLEAVLRKVAYVNQRRGIFSVWDENALREDFIDALQDPGHLSMSRERAVATANQILDIAEGDLGLIVRVGPQQLGFIHRVMQEQLAADHFNRLELADVQGLFAEYVGSPAWREVLLIAFRQISRPSELGALLDIVRGRIDESPAGLCAREFLAEITFGPFGLPPDSVKANASQIIDTIEAHAYGPHRARLLDAVIAGVSGPVTTSIVRECLDRWTLLVTQPSRELVAQIAQIPSDSALSEEVSRLLVFAIRNADKYDAFDIASSIATRGSTNGNDEERRDLHAALMNILADPPTGLAQAAALTALALGWREDTSVAEILNEARSHPNVELRLVALCDALEVLTNVFPGIPDVTRPATQALRDDEKEWLIEYLWTQDHLEVHIEMLVAAISASVRNDQSILLDLLDFLSSGNVSYLGSEVMLAVLLRAFADDERVADWVCDQIRRGGSSSLKHHISIGDIDPLIRAFREGSRHQVRVAESIELFLGNTDTKFMERSLFSLSAVDQGPLMRNALLSDLVNSSFPHWAADALVEHFHEDPEAIAQLRSVIMGDPARASKIANVISSVLDIEDVLPRLMEILRSLASSPSRESPRYDIVASALIRAYRETDPSQGPNAEHLMREAIDLIPDSLHWLHGQPRIALAAELYPAEDSEALLREFAERDDRPLVMFLRVYREETEKLRPFLEEASKILRSLPAYLRTHICRTLAERGTDPRLVSELTAHWADERSGLNKSVASFAYHQALLKINQQEPINEEEWNQALTHLGNQAVAIGPDHEDRRRAAWVGMCVLKDWSPMLNQLESRGSLAQMSVALNYQFRVPDRVLLQQIAASWEQLRITFGDQLLALLSGPFERDKQDHVWDKLALVASENAALEGELENEVAANPQLQTRTGIFMWILRRRVLRAEAVPEALTSFLRDNSNFRDEAARQLLLQPERMGLDPGQLQDAFEEVARGTVEGLALESLAMLCPDHPVVNRAWQFYSEEREANGRVNPAAYFALAYSVSSSDAVVAMIGQHYDHLCKVGNPYIDRDLARNVSNRLRRDTTVAAAVREAILNPENSDAQVAVLVSLLRNAVGLDDKLLAEIERRIFLQADRRLATVVRAPHVGSSLPVRTIFVDAAEGARDGPPA